MKWRQPPERVAPFHLHLCFFLFVLFFFEVSVVFLLWEWHPFTCSESGTLSVEKQRGRWHQSDMCMRGIADMCHDIQNNRTEGKPLSL